MNHPLHWGEIERNHIYVLNLSRSELEDIMATRSQSFTKFQEPRPKCPYFPFNRFPAMDCPWPRELTPPLVLKTMLGIAVLSLFIFMLNFWNRNNEIIKASAKEFVKEKTQYSPPPFHFDTGSKLGLVDQKRKWARSHGYEDIYLTYDEERLGKLAAEKRGEEVFRKERGEEAPVKNLKKTGKTVSWGRAAGGNIKRSLHGSMAQVSEGLRGHAPYSAPDALRGVVGYEL